MRPFWEPTSVPLTPFEWCTTGRYLVGMASHLSLGTTPAGLNLG